MTFKYRKESDFSQSKYIYFFNLVSHTDCSSKIINEFKIGHKPFEEVELKYKCLLWISGPRSKRNFLHYVLEGFIERKNYEYLNECTLMLKDMFRDNSSSTNDVSDKFIFKVKEINQIPIFSHFFKVNKLVTESMIRNEFIKHYLITALEEFTSHIKNKSPYQKRNKIPKIAHSNQKTFLPLPINSTTSSRLRERWNSKYFGLRDSYQLTKDITENLNEEPKNAHDTKVENIQMVSRGVPKYISKLLGHAQIIKPDLNYYNKSTKLYQNSLATEMYARKLKVLEHTEELIKRIKGDESNEITTTTELVDQKSQWYKSYNQQNPLNQLLNSHNMDILFESLNEIINKNFLICNPLKYPIITEEMKILDYLLVRNGLTENSFSVKNEKIRGKANSFHEGEIMSELKFINPVTNMCTEFESTNSITYPTN